ncbi:hypothetical protein GCM10028818_58120 [Spirosoma horti]
MQDLYDEHHGITKKRATNAPAGSSSPSEKPVRTRPERQTNEPAADQSTAGVGKSDQATMDGSTSRTRIGIRGGVTYPFYTEKVVGIDPALGFVGGLTFNFGNGTVSFQPEVNYARYSQKVNAFGFTTKVATDVLEVPLFLKISSGTYAGNRFFLNVGPYASYALSNSEDGKKISLDGAKGRFGFGAAAGVGAAIKAGPGHVTVEVRGLYPLGDTDNGFNTNSKTIFGQGTLGYIFPLGGR